MRKLFNTLYVSTQGAYLAKERETVAVYLEEDKKVRIPFHTLDGIVCFGNIRISPYLIGACGEKGLTLSYLSEYGKFLGRFSGPVSGNVLLRRRQYRFADDDKVCTKIAKNMIIGKIGNSNTVLKRFIRDYPDAENLSSVKNASRSLAYSLKRLSQSNSTETVRGIEGESAAVYFSVINSLVLRQKKDFFFNERSRRPPLDKFNALLSFLYTILHHDLTSACESVGLDPAVGFLHKDRPGRNSLSLDIMEEFRSFLVDRLVLTLINRQQIGSKDFKEQSSGAVYLKDKSRKKILEAYQKRKQDTVTHPFLGDKMPIGLLFYYQALLLCRYIRGDLEEYPPFLWS